MKQFFLLLILTTTAFADSTIAEFPSGPNQSITPGSLCDRPDSYRYQERIPYCERDVDSALKADVFKEYRNLGFTLPPSKRSQYKIDHLIPLCAGGSNREDNLWPQHKSVYTRTDALEFVGCEKLKAGKIKQADLIERILAAKRDLSLVSKTLRYLTDL